ncbi:BaiN/RdsA family NAD(P)/FAD-dependent oxidoreductase [Halomonas denitrificans]|nr:NAD(P)/FAD-dependent oxidoreductase [Halomonas denitrificans]
MSEPESALSPDPNRPWDVIVIGAGAAGLMCAITAGQRGRRVLVADHANKVGKKILMSGGGRCNFTNLHCGPENFLSANPHFVKSALARYTQWDFIALVDKHGIPWHEKTLGQLFCDRSSKDIVRMLLAECEAAGVTVRTHCPMELIERGDRSAGRPYRVRLTVDGTEREATCESLVIATGGYSIPRMGATGFGFDFARSLGLKVHPTRAALVPVTFEGRKLEQIADLAGVSLDSEVSAGEGRFREAMLFTHKGLSGPAVLQASSYWDVGQPMTLDLAPGVDLEAELKTARREQPKKALKTWLGDRLTKRVAERWIALGIDDKQMADLSDADIRNIADRVHRWTVWPSGSEGYATAEVTIGGVDTDALSSKTMECKDYPGLYFIGEVVDVTGHLGGHNFQWAWASGHAAGEVA